MKKLKTNFYRYTFFFVIALLLFFAGYFFNTYKQRQLEISVVDAVIPKEVTAWAYYIGDYYTISYPNTWGVFGPYEGPVTGFSEYLRLISPSGDMYINIGLDGDNRFRYVDTELIMDIKSKTISLNSISFESEEKYLSFDATNLGVITLDIPLQDKLSPKKYLADSSTGTSNVFRPFVIQLYYRVPNNSLPTDEEKIKQYEIEKEEALKILQTLTLK